LSVEATGRIIPDIAQITEQLDKCSGSVTDLYPILSHAALSTISEGMFLDPDEALFDIPYSSVGLFYARFG
jgi:hypothetical protein